MTPQWPPPRPLRVNRMQRFLLFLLNDTEFDLKITLSILNGERRISLRHNILAHNIITDDIPQLNILPLEGIQDFLRFTSMKSISQEPINKNSVIPRGLDHDPYICTNSC